MAKAVTGRIALTLLAGIAVTVFVVGLALFTMAARQNVKAGSASVAQVMRGIDAMGARAQEIAGEYASRLDVLQALAESSLAEAVVISSPTREDIDRLFVVATDGRIGYSWSRDDGDSGQLPELAARAADLASSSNPFQPLAPLSFTTAAGEFFLLAVAPLSQVERLAAEDPSRGAFVAVAVRFNAQRMNELANLADAGDLRIEAGPVPAGSLYPLIVGMDGEVVGRFVWTLPRPGNAVLGSVLPPVGGILIAFCACAVVVAFRTRRLVLALSERERLASAAARTDTVTNLVNRNGFNALLESAPVVEAGGTGQLGVIYLDINGFKNVNDSIGHRGGDELIRVLADRLASVLPADSVFARIGGDEFAALLAGKNARDTIAGAAAALVHALEEPFLIAGFEFHVTAAVGYAVATRPGTRPAEILRRADLAMYQAKAASEREAVAYHGTMETDALEKKRVEAALRKAIEVGELTVVYQPIVRTSDMTIAAFEALVRWDSKEFGAMAPALFVPVAEETGLIHEVGSFVIHRVCQDLAGWDTDLKIAINISPVQLRDPNFANDFLAMVERSGARPESFELELTEGILVSNPAIAKRKIENLKKLGFSLSLDDFGTGFSSIGYLRQFPFNKLKVDRSFVREIGVNPTANALIQAVVALGDAMELGVVAEGVENEEQLSLLRLLQCEFIQGFYLSRPMTAKQVGALLEEAGPHRQRISLRGGLGRWQERVDALSA